MSSLQLQTLPAQEMDIKEDFGDDLIRDTNEFGKHHLSSSESESDDEEVKDGKEDLLEKPISLSGFGQSLAFLSENIIKTESGARKTNEDAPRPGLHHRLHHDHD